MKKQLIEFPLENGKSIWVEAELSGGDKYDSEEEVAIGSATKTAARTFEDTLETTRNVAGSVIGKLAKLSRSPQEIDVEFNLKLNAKIGAVIASSGDEANFKVTLKWKQGQGND
jgi:hypothetical protein